VHVESRAPSCKQQPLGGRKDAAEWLLGFVALPGLVDKVSMGVVEAADAARPD
jgi:hypothetical protein